MIVIIIQVIITLNPKTNDQFVEFTNHRQMQSHGICYVIMGDYLYY